MPITLQNMEMRLSERPDGGRMGSSVVQDAVSNNVFPDVGTLALANGRVWLKSLFAFVNQDGSDVLTDAYVCITKPPSNPNADCALFTDQSWFSYQPDYQAYIQSYLINGGRISGHLMDRQLINTSTVQLWQKTTDDLQEIGKTYALSSGEGTSEAFDQAVNVLSMTYRDSSYVDVQGAFTRRIVTLGIRETLNHSFQGVPVGRYDILNEPAVARETVVSNAGARIFGIATLTQDAQPGDYLLQVDATMAQILPAAQRTAAFANVVAAGRSSLLVASGYAASFSTSLPLSPGNPLYIGSSSVPGTVTVAGSGYTLQEIGGQLFSGSTVVATVDAIKGVINPVAGSPPYTGPKTVSFIPAGNNAAPLQTLSVNITEASRSKTYVIPLPFKPAPMSVTVDYLAGDWIRLYEVGAGVLKGGKDEFGQGQIDSANTLTLTLGAYPDVGSRIIVSFGSAALTTDKSASIVQPGYFEFFTQNPITPLGLTITWPGGTASDDGHGILTGDADGMVLYSAKRIRIAPHVMPARGTVFSCSITPSTQATDTVPLASLLDGANPVQFTLQHGTVKPRTVKLNLSAVTRVDAPVYTPDPEIKPNSVGSPGIS